jgi:hypothetical protein
LKVAEPFGPREKKVPGLGVELSIRELIRPLDVKSARPEFIFGFNLDSDLPPHACTPANGAKLYHAQKGCQTCRPPRARLQLLGCLC